MQVSVESTGTLERRMKVQLPADQVDQEIDSRLKSIARSARIDGFRPGKVPMRVVQQRFGRQVEAEVAEELISRSFQEALARENLKPAGGPRFEPGRVETGKGLEYTATFEVMPEIEPAPLESEELEVPQAEITDADVDRMIDKLREQRATWTEVDREAREGDQINIDFRGTIDGEPFEGGEARGVDLVLGTGRMIPGFEEGLVGARAGETRTLDVTFPEDYQSEAVAGKAAQFEVKVNRVSEQKLPELDDEFARSLGIAEGGVEALRAEVRKNMERELEAARKAVIKDRAFDLLLSRNPVEVPAALVDEEIERLFNETYQQLGGNTQGLDLPRELFEDKARRRVTLGLIIGEIIQRNGIQVDPERVRETVESIAASYENPEEVVKWYYENPEALSGAQTLVLEDQVVDWIMSQVKTTEKTVGFDELVEMRQAAKS